ncbi:MAG: protein-L-isoaspartate(D-aspartate) O-methyltransferase [Limnohabitans sp.]|jgi:protein-L-isoaspartate(D-aspartate) O-methyltransferase|nr:protein-L-isoaspartate(D-aspartate) O-methyltransferase [Betaproteobacteria bacterium]NCW38708.1 protein-L-isoaspartate(D-aspartate) O-methyltransferase [Betaproteobacteria bacterium]
MKKRPAFPAQLDLGQDHPAPTPRMAVTRVQSSAQATKGTTAPAKPASVTPARPARAKAPAATTVDVAPTGLGLDSAQVRVRMVRKLYEQGIEDAMVLKAMETIERHRFVDSALVNQAYEDTSLPIGLGQTISKPNVVARMLALLRQGRNLHIDGKLGRVLEIGTGCGYQAALLSAMSKEVYSIERLRGLHEKARENLRHLRAGNLHLLFGDGMLGYAQGAPYAGIIAAAGGEAVPDAWIDQLGVGGRLVAPLVTAQGQQALLVLDKTPQGVQRQWLEAVHFVPLKSGVA